MTGAAMMMMTTTGSTWRFSADQTLTGELHEAAARVGWRRRLVDSLPQERLDGVDARDGFVGAAVGAALIGTQQDQVAMALVRRQELAHARRGRLVRAVGDRGHDPRQR